MSFVGKVLIVVQVILSLCFMAFAGAVYVTHENWQQKHKDAEQTIAELNKSKSDIEANLSQARDERAKLETELTQEVNKWKTAFVNEESQVKDLTSRLNSNATSLEQQTAIAVQSLSEADNREKESEALRKQNIDLQNKVSEVSAELNTERDRSFNANVALGQLQTRFGKLQIEAAFLAKVVRKHGLSTDPSEIEGLSDPPPGLQGLVTEVRKGRTNRTQFVVLSVGEDDGLKVGHELEALGKRDQKPLYLGTIKVISVQPDTAVCEVIDPSKLGDIEVGDNVTTDL
jgi:hypothetical protein